MKTIKWQRWKNPITDINMEGDTEEGKIIIRNTPFGLQPARVGMNDIAKNRIFIGHANFDVTEEVAEIISNVDGVESLETPTPYMFRIVVGKAFNSKKVRRIITETLCHSNVAMDFDDETDTNIYRETVKLRNSGKYWALYVLPNGKTESVTADTESDLEEKVFGWEDIRNKIGGIILSE